MTFAELGKSYIKKAIARFDTLAVLMKNKDYSDVIRESQEIVELVLKGILRIRGIEPPKIHDVGGLLLEYREKFAEINLRDIKKLAKISKELRKEREFSFYGDVDFIPTEEYSKADARNYIKKVKFVIRIGRKFLEC